MSKFAPSFYCYDRTVDGSVDTSMNVFEEDDLLTAVELASNTFFPSKLPVFSTYIHAGMVPPAYNVLPESKSVKIDAQLQEIPVPLFNANSQESLSAYSLTRENAIQEPLLKEYKESAYLGFQNDAQAAYGRCPEKLVSFVTVPQKILAPKSRLVEPTKMVDSTVSEPEASFVSDDLISVQGDAFRPVVLPHSEYHFCQLNGLFSCNDLKH